MKTFWKIMLVFCMIVGFWMSPLNGFADMNEMSEEGLIGFALSGGLAEETVMKGELKLKEDPKNDASQISVNGKASDLKVENSEIDSIDSNRFTIESGQTNSIYSGGFSYDNPLTNYTQSMSQEIRTNYRYEITP